MRRPFTYMMVGSAITLATYQYLKNNNTTDKAVRKIIRTNEQAINWLKNKMN